MIHFIFVLLALILVGALCYIVGKVQGYEKGYRDASQLTNQEAFVSGYNAALKYVQYRGKK